MSRRMTSHSTDFPPVECESDERREAVRSASLNGIDYVEVSEDQRTLTVFFLGKAPPEVGVANVKIDGGRRERDIRVETVDVHREPRRGRDDWMDVIVDRPGDFSTYVLRMVEPGKTQRPMRGFDPRYSTLEFSFKAGCPGDLDCKPDSSCMPEPGDRPDVNYLARDYAGLRQLLLDRLSVVMPDWRERHVPDLGVTLVELLAYTGDYLSQFQDAVATEAYLDTARLRISVRRHARLVDYHLYEGSNARAWLALKGKTDVQLDLSKVKFATRFDGAPDAGNSITFNELERMTDVRSEIFEPAWPAVTSFWVRSALSEMHFYTWGDGDCCIPAGATEATLADEWVQEETTPTGGGVILLTHDAVSHDAVSHEGASHEGRRRRLENLQAGDVLIIEEVLGPSTGNPADADPSHRHAVRLIEVRRDVDRLYPEGREESPGTPIVHIRWRAEDKLPFAVCVSTTGPAPECAPLNDVSVVRGNVILVDHGVTVSEDLPPVPQIDPAPVCDPCDDVEPPERPERFDPVLEKTPLTFKRKLDTSGSAARMTEHDSRDSEPSLELFSRDTAVSWIPRPDLLDSSAGDRHFVVEIDDEARAHLRFSADFDARPEGGTRLRAEYRIGNGRAGNVGAETISVVIAEEVALGGSALVVRNPLAAVGGTNAETVAEAKQFAPSAFRVRRERAVIANDYAELLARDFAGDVQGAASALRWNGSWFEAQTGIDARGQEQAASALVRRARGRLHRYRRIGHDLSVESARLVPLIIAMDVCVSPHHLRANVVAELRDKFSSRRLRNGQLGYFHPDKLRYGESVKVSALVAAAYNIPGISSIAVTRLERLDEGPNQELENGLLPLGPLEIAQVDSDPIYPDRGAVTFTVGGGR